jgi:hypothetical protein
MAEPDAQAVRLCDRLVTVRQDQEVTDTEGVF